jgi:photosystem II stability/assembly factor-like uncharacterized protein
VTRPLLSERMEEVFLLKRTPPGTLRRAKCNTGTNCCQADYVPLDGLTYPFLLSSRDGSTPRQVLGWPDSDKECPGIDTHSLGRFATLVRIPFCRKGNTMNVRYISLAITIALLCSCASGQWVRTNFPMASSPRSLMMVDTMLFVGDYEGNLLRSSNGGTHWDTVSRWPLLVSGKGYYNAWYHLIALDSFFIAAIVEKRGMDETIFLVRSTDSGRTWKDTTKTLGWVKKLTVVGCRIFAPVDDGTILQLTDGGATWESVSQAGLPADNLGGFVVKDSLLFCGTLNNGLFQSASFGKNWTSIEVALGSHTVIGLDTVGKTLFCLMMKDPTNLLYRSTDNGSTWNNVSPGSSNADWTAGQIYSHGGLAFATTASQNLIVSTDCGDSWKPLGGGLPANVPGYVYSFAFSDSFAFAAGGGGVWRRPLTEFASSVEHLGEEDVRTFSVSQNYPNPFNPSTTIRYGVPSRAHVTLTVFNTLGQQVSTLVQGDQDPGYHEVKFDAQNLPSGVYFYRMHAGGYTVTKKLLYLR